jgi:hypothetical protein
MDGKVRIMKITKNSDGYAIRIPIKFARELGMTGGYVNIYRVDDKQIIEKTFKSF